MVFFINFYKLSYAKLIFLRKIIVNFHISTAFRK